MTIMRLMSMKFLAKKTGNQVILGFESDGKAKATHTIHIDELRYWFLGRKYQIDEPNSQLFEIEEEDGTVSTSGFRDLKEMVDAYRPVSHLNETIKAAKEFNRKMDNVEKIIEKQHGRFKSKSKQIDEPLPIEEESD